MAKPSSSYVCQECGSAHSKWAGQCSSCGAWNSLVIEATAAAGPPKGLGKQKGARIEFNNLQTETPPLQRIHIGIAELDRVCGGGLVPGAALLVGGDPGIGKSTLLLQAACALSTRHSVVYISGEESIEQIKMRAQRLGLGNAPLQLAAATSVRDIVASLDNNDAPMLCVIDSIQTMYLDNIDAAPGTVSQVRAASQEFIRIAKRRNIVMILVGHVTKEGLIAGPRVLEHMVDTVLYFEGERGHQFRILRTVKNRFGATDEIGVFEMTQLGLQEVANPSELFLSERQSHVTGSCVFAGVEGTRPVLVEVQALLAPTSFGTPRRAVIGWDSGRLAMIMAVLETRCGVQMGMNDVFLNIAGGLRISEPAADLAVAAALLSALNGIPLPHDTVFFGEVGLSGEVRAVGQTDLRLKEASKLGFAAAMMPKRRNTKNTAPRAAEFNQREISRLDELVAFLQDHRHTRKSA